MSGYLSEDVAMEVHLVHPIAQAIREWAAPSTTEITSSKIARRAGNMWAISVPLQMHGFQQCKTTLPQRIIGRRSAQSMVSKDGKSSVRNFWALQDPVKKRIPKLSLIDLA